MRARMEGRARICTRVPQCQMESAHEWNVHVFYFQCTIDDTEWENVDTSRKLDVTPSPNTSQARRDALRWKHPNDPNVCSPSIAPLRGTWSRSEAADNTPTSEKKDPRDETVEKN